MLKGKLLAIINGGAGLEVRAPSAVAAAEGTTFEVEVGDDGASILTVVQGEALFYNEFGCVTVADSEQSTARLGEAPSRLIVVDPSSLMAWEASLETFIIEVEYPPVPSDLSPLKARLQTVQSGSVFC